MSNLNKPETIKHFTLICPQQMDAAMLDAAVSSLAFPHRYQLDNSRAVLLTLPRTEIEAGSGTMEKPFTAMVCGDSQDAGVLPSLFLGNGIHIVKQGGELQLASSLTGLPPMFIYQDRFSTIIADSIESIARLPGCCLHFDQQAVLELASIGAPINHRTLFKEIKIIPAGSLLRLTGDVLTIEENVWQPETTEQFDDLKTYVSYMADHMQAAIARMEIEHSFLALTAGLDTRSVLASLVGNGKLIPSFTISGSDLTLDAMRAGQLCSAYGIDHNIVAIDHAAPEKLPEYTRQASLYSGGLNSIEQATELYFYEMAGAQFNGRLSGNLGNQIGRSGTEGTGVRQAPVSALSAEVRAGEAALDSKHWFFQVNQEEDLLAPSFLIQRENLFAQLGNYSIGHEMVTQHTPYADNQLIHAKYREPLASRDQPKTISEIKMRDLKHRILGQSPQRSFQCHVVQQVGGAVADCPINWGWKTNGGFSAGGLYYGAKAFTDIAAGNRLNRIPGANKILKAMGIKGFSSFHTRHILYTGHMKAFIKDVLHSSAVRQSGMFDNKRLDYLVAQGLDGQMHYDEVVLALDLALAVENFHARL